MIKEVVEVVEIVRELQKRHEIKNYYLAYRFNNIVDLYKDGKNVYVIPENQYYKLQLHELLSFIESKLLFHKGYVKESKKGELGISDKEFSTKKEEIIPEKYQCKKNLDEAIQFMTIFQLFH
jgi:hypothetical protein